MVKIKRGYRRLYEASGCDMEAGQEFSTSFVLDGGIGVDVYIGKKPRFGITVYRAPRYLTVGSSIELASISHTVEPEGDKAGLLYVEIFCWQEIGISNEVARGLEANDARARNSALALSQKNESTLKSATDMVAGVLGLRFHRQFVLQKCDENIVAVPPTVPYVFSMVTPAVEVLESVRVPKRAIEQIKICLDGLAQVETKHHKWAASAMFFLMRAWAEADPISKFMSLFIPFELVLQDVSVDTGNPHIEGIRKLIEEEGGGQMSELLRCFDHLARANRPSLNMRFEKLASDAKLDGWEQDIIAVTKFNKMRNALLHQGESRVALMIAISDGPKPAAQLEDIVERYLSLRIFGDGAVYKSTYRNRVLPKLDETEE